MTDKKFRSKGNNGLGSIAFSMTSERLDFVRSIKKQTRLTWEDYLVLFSTYLSEGDNLQFFIAWLDAIDLPPIVSPLSPSDNSIPDEVVSTDPALSAFYQDLNNEEILNEKEK